MAQVLGIAVVDRQVASVIHDADGSLLASNLIELDLESPGSVEEALHELMGSIPYDVDSIGLACADSALTESMMQRLAPGPGRPDWYNRITVTDVAPALAQVAVTEGTSGGMVALVNLDESSAPTPGLSIVTVDSATGAVKARSHFDQAHSHDEPSAVVDPVGANTVAGAIASMPGGDAVTSVICTGPGASIPGVAPAFEYAMQRPVQIAQQPVYAIASGAASISQQFPSQHAGDAAVGAANLGSADANAGYDDDDYATEEYSNSDYATDNYGSRDLRRNTAYANVGDQDLRGPTIDGGDGDYQRANRRRWWLVGAAVAGSLFVAAIAGAAVLFGTGTAQRVVEGPTLSVTTSTVTTTQPRETVTHTENVKGDATTKTTTVTPPRTTITHTAPGTTVTETATVTEYNGFPSGAVPSVPGG